MALVHTLSWSNISIQNSQGKPILENVWGQVKSGEMLALMGPSGSGKTTLLNSLNFRLAKNLKQSPDCKVCINGTQVGESIMSQAAGFVQQDDAFFPYLTVEEHLYFHVNLFIAFSLKRRRFLMK